MASVTVPGTGGSEISISAVYNNTSNNLVAQQIAGLLANAASLSSLSITSVSGSGTIPPPAVGTVNELLLGTVTGGQVTIPSSGSAGYVVVYDSSAPITIHGSPNTTVLGGSGNITIIDPVNLVVGDVNASTPGGNDTLILTSSDSKSSATGNNGNDTIAAAGNDDTITSGTGHNILSSTGLTNIINSFGTDSIVSSGDAASITGSNLNDTIKASGTSTTIVGGTGQNLISATGASNSITAAVGTDSIIASGDGTAIGLGTGFTAVTLTGAGVSQTVFGGGGLFTVLDDAISTSANPSEIGFSTTELSSGVVTLTGSNIAVFTGIGAASVVDNGTADSVGGFTGALAVTQSGAGSQVFGNAGGVTALMSGNNESLNGGNKLGNVVATITGADAVVGASNGATNLSISGAGAIVNGNVGILSIFDDGGGLAFGGVNAGNGGIASITVSGGGDRLVSSSVVGSVLNVVGAGTGTSETVVMTGGNGFVTAGGSNFTVNDLKGSGLLSFVGGSGTSTIKGGVGGATVLGGAGGSILYNQTTAGAQALFYRAGAGNETLNASGSTAVTADTLAGATVGGSSATITGGQLASDTFVAGKGSDSYIGGKGANTFIFDKAVINNSTPTDSITGFFSSTVSGGDHVLLQGYGTAAASIALGSAVSDGVNTTLTLSDNTKITFVGVASSGFLNGHISST